MVLWGSLFPMVKLAFSAYHLETTADILFFAGVRFVICGAFICALSYVKDKSTYKTAHSFMRPILLSGVFSIVLHYGFSYLGLELTVSSKAALLKQVGALFYVCFSFLFIKEDKPNVKKLIAATIGFLGIFVLNITEDGFSLSLGDILILLSSFCTIFSNVISKKIFKSVDPITATGISQLFGGILILAIGAVMGGSVSFELKTAWIMLYILAASIVSYCIWYGILKKGELSSLFIIKFTEPVFAAIFGAILLKEDIWNIKYLLAFILVGGGIVISNVSFAKKIKLNDESRKSTKKTHSS